MRTLNPETRDWFRRAGARPDRLDRGRMRLSPSLGRFCLPGLCVVAVLVGLLLPTAAQADHPCSPDPNATDYDPLCEQEGEVGCDPKNPATCVECWDCIDNDGDGLFDCQDNLDAEGVDNPNGGCAAYCLFLGPDGLGAYDQDDDGDGYIDCPIGAPSPPPDVYDCDDSECLVHPDAPELCSDGVDNDCDGLLDDADADCVGASDDDDAGSDDDDDADCDDTNPFEFDCANGCDDDNDGLVDCEDIEECGADPLCDGFTGGGDGGCGDDDDDDDDGPGDDDSSQPPDDDDSGPWGDDDDAHGDDDTSSADDDDISDDDDTSDDDDSGEEDDGGDDGASSEDDRRRSCTCSWAGSSMNARHAMAVVLVALGLGAGRRRRWKMV